MDGERDLRASALANPTASSYLLPLLQEHHGNELKLYKLAAKCFSSVSNTILFLSPDIQYTLATPKHPLPAPNVISN